MSAEAGGTRTRNLQIAASTRSPMRYPLRHGVLDSFLNQLNSVPSSNTRHTQPMCSSQESLSNRLRTNEKQQKSPRPGRGWVKQTSLSALIGRGSHGSALSGQVFGHAGKTPPPLHSCPYSSKRSYKVCGSREGIVRDSSSDSESPVRRVKRLFCGVGLFGGFS